MNDGPSAPDPVALELVDDVERAGALLHPLRMKLLASVRTPRTAAELAGAMDLTRQKVGYHLRELQKHGLLTVQEPEADGGRHHERRFRSSADHYLIDPAILGPLAPPIDDDATIGTVSLGTVSLGTVSLGTVSEGLPQELADEAERLAGEAAGGTSSATPTPIENRPHDEGPDDDGGHGPCDPGRLLALSARLQSELRTAIEQTPEGRPSTIALTVDAAFDDAKARTAFAQSIVDAVHEAVDEYAISPLRAGAGDDALRRYRVLVGCYPRPAEPPAPPVRPVPPASPEPPA